MKSIKEQINKKENKNTEGNVDEMDAFLMHETLSSTIHFLWGYYSAYCRFNEIESVTAEEFFNTIDKMPSYDNEEKRKQYLQENKNNNIEKFLWWYFYE